MDPLDLPVDSAWRFVSIGVEGGSVDIRGMNPWEHEWISTGGRVVVAHPSYPSQRHTMKTYELLRPQGPITFAAGEFSNGVWGFFVPSLTQDDGA